MSSSSVEREPTSQRANGPESLATCREMNARARALVPFLLARWPVGPLAVWLFIAQYLCRAYAGCTQRLRRHGEPCDCEREEETQDERRERQTRTLREDPQIETHHEPGERPREQICQHDRLREIDEQQAQDALDARTERLAHADLVT